MGGWVGGASRYTRIDTQREVGGWVEEEAARYTNTSYPMHLAEEMQRRETEEGHLEEWMYSWMASFLCTQKMNTSCLVVLNGCVRGGWVGGWMDRSKAMQGIPARPRRPGTPSRSRAWAR